MKVDILENRFLREAETVEKVDEKMIRENTDLMLQTIEELYKE